MRLDPGRSVHCSDTELGTLVDVVVDPRARCVTHVVVEPAEDPSLARLVPVTIIEDDGETLRLGCTRAEVDDYPLVRELSYERLGAPPSLDPQWQVGITTVLALPPSLSSSGLDVAMPYDDSVEMVYDRVPIGTVELKHGSPVLDTEGRQLGRVDGFTVGDGGAITHLVLERGHLWGKRDVTIPVDAVARVENDEVVLSLSHDEVAALPAVRVRRHPSA